MFLQGLAEENSLRTGTLPVRFTFGRCSRYTKTFPYEPGSTIGLDSFSSTYAATTHHTVPLAVHEPDSFRYTSQHLCVLQYFYLDVGNHNQLTQYGTIIEEDEEEVDDRGDLCFYGRKVKTSAVTNKTDPSLVRFSGIVFRWTIAFTCLLIDLRVVSGARSSSVHFSLVFLVATTVRSLYAGTLVGYQTTAPSQCKKRPSSAALLAALCLLLATLTIAARCYASNKGVANPLAQALPPNRHPLSPIHNKDSKFQTHSSTLVLSRFYRVPLKGTKGDTSVILTNSKRRNATRTKRSLATHHANTIDDLDGLTGHKGNSIPRRSYPIYFLRLGQSSYYNPSPSASKPPEPSYTFKRLLLDSESAPSVDDTSTTVDVSPTSASESNVSASVSNRSGDNGSRAGADTWREVYQQQQLDRDVARRNNKASTGLQRPMPPVHDHTSNSLSQSTVFVIVVSGVLLTVALGLVTCVLSHYRGGTAADPHDAGQTPTTAPMLSVVSAGAAAGVGGMDRLRGRGHSTRDHARDRQLHHLRHPVHTDIAINLPPSIALPDGEDHHFTSSRLLKLRDAEQESEILQKCIRPPPNRTVSEKESPPPYRSSSAGLLGSMGSSSSSSGSGGGSDWSTGSSGAPPLVVRCHSMSSTAKRPPDTMPGQKTDFIQRTVKIFTGKKAPSMPVVVVPTRRSTDSQNSSSFSSSSSSSSTSSSSTTTTTAAAAAATSRPKPNV